MQAIGLAQQYAMAKSMGRDENAGLQIITIHHVINVHQIYFIKVAIKLIQGHGVLWNSSPDHPSKQNESPSSTHVKAHVDKYFRLFGHSQGH